MGVAVARGLFLVIPSLRLATQAHCWMRKRTLGSVRQRLCVMHAACLRVAKVASPEQKAEARRKAGGAGENGPRQTSEATPAVCWAAREQRKADRIAEQADLHVARETLKGHDVRPRKRRGAETKNTKRRTQSGGPDAEKAERRARGMVADYGKREKRMDTTMAHVNWLARPGTSPAGWRRAKRAVNGWCASRRPPEAQQRRAGLVLPGSDAPLWPE